MLAGCTHLHRDPQGSDLGEIGFITRIARSPLEHRTRIEIRPEGDESWATIERSSDIRVRAGINRIRFEGQWIEPADPDRRDCPGCANSFRSSGSGVGDVIALLAIVAIGSAVAVNRAEAHRQDVVAACAAEVALDVEEGDDIELQFRHDDKDRCDVVCQRYDDSGRKPCRVVETVASD